MKRFNSVIYAVLLASNLSIFELPLNNRTDVWWDMFWNYYGLTEAKEFEVLK